MLLKKYLWELEKKNLFYIILFLTVSYSLPVHTSLTDKSLTTPPPSESHSWIKKIRQTKSPIEILKRRFNQNYYIIQKLYDNVLITELVWEASEISKTENHAKQSIELSNNFFNMLNNASPEQINSFTNKKGFTKTQKMMTLIFLIYKNRLGESIFDLMNLFDLSVNDTLSFEDLTELKNTSNHEFSSNPESVITVLSHQLAATGDPKVIQRLIKDKNYDPTVKNYLSENVLHSFFGINYSIVPRTEHSEEYIKAFSMLAKHSKHSINEKDALGYTPLALAVKIGQQDLVQVLMDKKLSADLNTTNLENQSLIDIVKKEKNINMFHYIENQNLIAHAEKLVDVKEANNKAKSQLEQLKTEGLAYPEKIKANEDMLAYLNKQNPKANPKYEERKEMIYFDFEPLTKKIASAMIYYSKNSDKHFQDIKAQIYRGMEVLQDYENERFKSLVDLFYLEKGNINPAFEALLKKDTQFFLEPTEEQKEMLTEIFYKTDMDNKRYFISNFLLEAIRYSFLPAVKYMLENYHQSTLVFEDNAKSVSFDPLSLALITYASLEEGHPSKKEAKNIVNLVRKFTGIEDYYTKPLNLLPINYAMLFGLAKEVEFLYEDSESLAEMGLTNENYMITFIQFANFENYKKLNKFYQSIGLGVLTNKSNGETLSDCRKFFKN